MFKRFIEVTLVLSLVFAVQTSQAFFDPPWITPATPKAGEIVSVNISGGICDVFVEWTGYPQLTRSGDAIRIVKYGNHEGFEDFCIYGLWTVTEPLGTFLPGDYTLTVDLAYDDALYGPTIMTLGVVAFTVTAATPGAPVPASSEAALLVLLLLVLGVSLWSLRIRRQSHC